MVNLVAQYDVTKTAIAVHCHVHAESYTSTTQTITASDMGQDAANADMRLTMGPSTAGCESF